MPVNRKGLDGKAVSNMRQNALQKAVFRTLKDGLLQAERRPFANTLTARELQEGRKVENER